MMGRRVTLNYGVGEGYGDSAWEDKAAVEDYEREEREAAKFMARVAAYNETADDDLELDEKHDSGEDEWRDD